MSYSVKYNIFGYDFVFSDLIGKEFVGAPIDADISSEKFKNSFAYAKYACVLIYDAELLHEAIKEGYRDNEYYWSVRLEEHYKIEGATKHERRNVLRDCLVNSLTTNSFCNGFANEIEHLIRKIDAEEVKRREKETVQKRIRQPLNNALKIVYQFLAQRDGEKCIACGAVNNLQVDHIIPVSKGGDNSPSNLQLLCQPCNLKKGAK